MTQESYDLFIANIQKTLEKNGYPDKRVALPLERMYEIAYEKNLNFNKALDYLYERGVAHEKTNDKVIFYARLDEVSDIGSPEDFLRGFDPDSMDTSDFEKKMAMAQEAMKNMPPEKLQQIEEMYRNMTDEQKDELMRKAKDLGLL